MTAIQLLQWVTFASLLFWLLAYWQAGLKILADIQSALKSRNSRMDVVLLILMAVFSFVITVTAFRVVLGQKKFGFPRNLELPDWLTAVGCLLTILGMAGTFYCHHQLVAISDYMLKAKDEETFLEQSLAGYVEYKERVRHRLIPGIW